jgi:polyferredoxin
LVTLIDRLVIVLGALALFTGLLAFRHWQFVVLLVTFTGLVALHFTGHRRVRWVSSLLAVVVALVALVAWWWAVIDDLSTQTNNDADSIALGGGVILTGVSLGLQIFVGLLMFAAACPLAAFLSALRRR